MLSVTVLNTPQLHDRFNGFHKIPPYRFILLLPTLPELPTLLMHLYGSEKTGKGQYQ